MNLTSPKAFSVTQKPYIPHLVGYFGQIIISWAASMVFFAPFWVDFWSQNSCLFALISTWPVWVRMLDSIGIYMLLSLPGVGHVFFCQFLLILFFCFFLCFLHFCGRLLEYSRNVPQFSFKSVQIALSTSPFAPFLQWRQNHCKIQWIWHFGDVVWHLLWGIEVACILFLASFWQLLRLLESPSCLHFLLISTCIFFDTF